MGRGCIIPLQNSIQTSLSSRSEFPGISKPACVILVNPAFLCQPGVSYSFLSDFPLFTYTSFIFPEGHCDLLWPTDRVNTAPNVKRDLAQLQVVFSCLMAMWEVPERPSLPRTIFLDKRAFLLKRSVNGVQTLLWKKAHLKLLWWFFEAVILKKRNPEFKNRFIAEIHRKSWYIRRVNCRENRQSLHAPHHQRHISLLEFCSKYSDNIFGIYSAYPLCAPFSPWQTLAHGGSSRFPIIILLGSMKVRLSWCWKHSQTA